MNCQEFQLFADAYVDGEFEDRERGEIEGHIRSCADCRAQAELRFHFKERFKEVLSCERAPETLRLRIIEQLEQAEHEAQRTRRRNSPVMRAAVVAAPLAASIILVLVFLPELTVMPAASEQLPVVENTIDWHKGNLPIEVTGPQNADVARWFRGKVDFPVRLPTFHSERVHLIGGRIAHVKDRRAAYALYDVDGARLSVMMFHSNDFKVPGDKIRTINGREVAVLNSHGYEVAVLQDNGITYTMTSDLPENELLKLVGASLRP